jgi:hypothetical protein
MLGLTRAASRRAVGSSEGLDRTLNALRIDDIAALERSGLGKCGQVCAQWKQFALRDSVVDMAMGITRGGSCCRSA